MSTARDHVRDIVSERPGLTALEFRGLPVSRGELLRKARAVAVGLRAHGIQPGASVGLFLFEPVPIVEGL